MNITIRPWYEEDAWDLHNMAKHPFYLHKRIWGYLYPDTFLHSISTIRFYQQADPKKFLYRAIVYENEVCGYLQCEKKTSGSCELSYWLGVEYWNKGIMRVALASFFEEVFSSLDVVMIYARVECDHIASQKVLEQNGFFSEQIDRILIFRKYR